MSHPDGRCPRCAALVQPNAPWCTLCYVDLRAPDPVPEPAPEPTPPPSPVDAAETAPGARPGRHRSVDADVLEPTPGDLLVRPRRAAAEAAAGWPCRACGERVSFDLTACGACGTGFLDVAADPTTLVLPLVGDLMAMTRGRRAALGAVAATALGLVLLLLATVAGLFV